MTEPFDRVESFAWQMAGMEDTAPTLDVLREATGLDDRDLATILAEAIASGLVEACHEHGPVVVFALSPLAAGRMKIELTYDSRRWVYRKGKRLVGPAGPAEAAKYRPRRPRVDDRYISPIDLQFDRRQLEPHVILAAIEEMTARRHYDAEHLPHVRQFLGHNAIWPVPKPTDGVCPCCGNAKLKADAYCLPCDNSGADPYLFKKREDDPDAED